MATALEYFEELRKRLAELEAHPPGPGDPAAAAHYQEIGRLEKSLRPYDEYLKLAASREEAEALANDASQDEELRALAREEARRLAAREAELFKALLVRVALADGADRSSAIVEIRAGTGGEEAALFVADLLKMYRRYCEEKGWKVKMLDASPTDLGGFREVIFRVEGEGAFARLRLEAGTHRVQRVPKTEAQGRIHTSVATVAVLAEPEQVELQIPESDLEITVMRSAGPGGQSVNTTDSCVRIVHKPTGLAVKCMVEKSQHKNKALAMSILRARLLEAEQSKKDAERSRIRRTQIGTGERSERIRTYNFPQNRVTDHRLEGERSFLLERVIEGDLDPVIERLIEQAAGVSQAGREDASGDR